MTYQNEKITDPAVENRLNVLLTNSGMSQKHKEFVTSLVSAWKRYKGLTKRQYDYFETVEKQYDPATVSLANKQREEWVASWDEWKRVRFNICCRYYALTSYFRDLAAKGLSDPSFIPTEKQFRAMCENKYAERLIKNMTENAYDVGQVVQLRRRNEDICVGSICEVSDEITRNSANIGCRRYRVFWMHNGNDGYVFEKDIKLYKNK